jgi:formylglycine-generating enzyme required for sulfatase activity
MLNLIQNKKQGTKMNVTSQYIVNPKSRDTYRIGLAPYKSIHPSTARLRLGYERQVLNDKKKYKIFRVEGTDFTMIHCPRGKFMMGVSEDDRNPKRVVSIKKPFLLGEAEVTQELFEKVMGFNPSLHKGVNYHNSKQRPVEQVTWYDAVMFCNKLSERLGRRPYYNMTDISYEDQKSKTTIQYANLSYNLLANGFRLPYEKEWEYAAKSGSVYKYVGTNDKSTVVNFAWSKYDARDETHPIKGKLPNQWGFYDMLGNVWEWCCDKNEEPNHIARGGSIKYPTILLRNTFRSVHKPEHRVPDQGFRIAMSISS